MKPANALAKMPNSSIYAIMRSIHLRFSTDASACIVKNMMMKGKIR